MFGEDAGRRPFQLRQDHATLRLMVIAGIVATLAGGFVVSVLEGPAAPPEPPAPPAEHSGAHIAAR
jgi:hypothetical protein